MLDEIKKGALRLAELRGASGSDEEFRLKAAAEGGAGFWAAALFRLCLFRNEHPGLEWLELGAFLLGAAGFALWCGLAGPRSPLGTGGILLLALAVLVPLELPFLWFEDLRRGVARKAGR